MGKWEMVRLSEVGEIVTGTTPPTTNPEYYNSNDIAFYKPGDLRDREVLGLDSATVYVSKLAESKIRLLPKGSVLVTCIGIIGKVGVALDECTCNQQINAIIPKSKKVDSRYLAYSLLSKKNHLESIANAPIVPIVNKTKFSGVFIPLPPLETQKQIAKTLDAVSELLALRKQHLAELDSLIKSAFYDMFGDPECYTNSLEQLEFSSVVDGFKYGTSVKSSYEQRGYPVLRIPNVVEGLINLDDLQYNNTPNNEYQKLKLKENDLLFVRSNGNQEYVGRSAVVGKQHEGFVYASYLIRARIDFNRKQLNPIYLIELFRTDFMRKKIKGKAITTAGQYNINTRGLGSLEVLLPPLPLQNQFASIVSKINEQKALVQKAIDETQYLFDCLMSEYFD